MISAEMDAATSGALGVSRPSAVQYWALLAIALFVTMLCGFDYTGASVALASIARDMHADPVTAQWVLSASQIVNGSCLILGGRFADLFGQRRCVVIALGVYVFGALLGAFSTSMPMLIAGRAATGLTAALALPALLSLYFRTVEPGPRFNRVLAIHGTGLALGGALGMVIGGALTTLVGWRGMLETYALYAVLLLALACTLLPVTAPSSARKALDIPGAALATLGCALLILAMGSARKTGLADPTTAAIGGGALLVLLLLIVVEKRSRNPILPLSLFARPGVAGVLISGVLGFAAAAAPFFILTLYLQNVGGYAPREVGLLFLPKAFAVAAAGQLTPWLMKRLAPRFGLALGNITMAAGFLIVVLWGTPISPVVVLCSLMAFGAGSVVAMVVALAEVPRQADPAHRGVASAVVMATLSIATAFGIAVLALVLQPQTAGAALNYDAAFYTASGAAALAAVIALFAVGGARRPS